MFDPHISPSFVAMHVRRPWPRRSSLTTCWKRHDKLLILSRWLSVGHALACPEKAWASSARRDKLKRVLLKSTAQWLPALETAQKADPRSSLPAQEEEARQECRAGRLKPAPRRVALILASMGVRDV
jgi:hypothetical protein